MLTTRNTGSTVPMERCLISLGGNVGDVAARLAWAVDRLAADADVRVTRVSGFYDTEPVGSRAGPTFLNAAVELHTRLSPHGLLALLQSLESAAGRQRGARWSPRPLDLDVITYGARVIASAELCVPHPACWYRRFVLDPVAEIAADVRHPLRGKTFGALRKRLLVRPLPIALAGGDADRRDELVRFLAGKFSEIHVFDWATADVAVKETAAIVLWLGKATSPEDAVDSSSRPLSARFEDLPKPRRLDLSDWPPSRQPDRAAEIVLSAIGQCVRRGD